MNKIIENIKSGNYEIVDNQGVSVTEHFTHCLEKEFADLEAKLAESEEKCEEFKQVISKCTGELPLNVAFDIANDDIRYQIVCNLTDRNQEHRNTIKQLKQQLAGLQQEKIEYTDTINFVETSEPDIVAKELDRLNQQLAEKEKELSELKRIGEKGHLNDLIEEKRKENKILIKAIEKSNQDKISFAVEKLTELKKWIDEMLNGWKTNQDVNQLTRAGICLSLENVGYKIDNQIKQLKEGK